MKPDPVLARTVLPADPEQGRRYPHTFIVEGGLHYIRGNSAPYFTLTYTEHRRGFPNQEESGGCNPELILQHFPQFADLAALHLSDINGVPMHAEGNGWYDLAGALGGFGEKYHAGNSKRNFPLPSDKIDPAKSYITTEHRCPTREECLQMFARHCRVTPEEARAIMAEADPLNWRNTRADYDPRTKTRFRDWVSMEQTNPGYLANCRGRWAAICTGMHPRWKLEADACISKHGLTLYGDPWTGDRRPAARPPGLRLLADVHAGEVARGPEDSPEPTYTDRWGITSTASAVDHNPNFDDASGDMDHWRVTLRRGRAKMTVYYSMGSLHAGRVPTAQEVIDCIAQDNTRGADFEEWARDLGLDPDSRKAHRTYSICKRQAERLQKFLGAERCAELTGGEA